MTTDNNNNNNTSSSPHGQLLTAFAALQKEKESLSVLAILQKQETDQLSKELESTKELLGLERGRADELEARLELKSASIDCRIAEAVEDCQAAFDNRQLRERVRDLTSEKESLLARTAALARRDQIQKASIATFEIEIERLTEQLAQFEDRFSSLAIRASESIGEHHQQQKQQKQQQKEEEDNRQDESNTQQEPQQEPQQPQTPWETEKNELSAEISELRALCEKLQTNEEVLQQTFKTTLSQHQALWKDERYRLTQEISDLVAEKESIEVQVAEIAELLESTDEQSVMTNRYNSYASSGSYSCDSFSVQE